MTPVLLILIAVLAFVAIGGVGWVFVGHNDNEKTVKRAQAIAAAPSGTRVVFEAVPPPIPPSTAANSC